MATQPTTDAPFGLQPNIAAGLAYAFTWLGGLIMLFGGGTNKMVKWAAAQAITLFIFFIAAYIALIILSIVLGMIHLGVISAILSLVLMLAWFGSWVYTVIMGFQGKDIRLPYVSQVAQQLFGSQLA
jgi:uncharacterized membrane protein